MGKKHLIKIVTLFMAKYRCHIKMKKQNQKQQQQKKKNKRKRNIGIN